MADEKKSATKEYVVVFDQVDVATGELQTAPGMHPVALTTSHVRGDKVSLDAETAARHLETGAVIAASDPAAKHVKKNDPVFQGVKRDPVVAAVPLEEQTTPTLEELGAGAKARGGTSLGKEAELKRMKTEELKALAAKHNVEVEPKDTKATLAKKLSKVRVAAGTGGETVNPGQGKDESAPPVDQPDEAPDAK